MKLFLCLLITTRYRRIGREQFAGMIKGTWQTILKADIFFWAAEQLLREMTEYISPCFMTREHKIVSLVQIINKVEKLPQPWDGNVCYSPQQAERPVCSQHSVDLFKGSSVCKPVKTLRSNHHIHASVWKS